MREKFLSKMRAKIILGQPSTHNQTKSHVTVKTVSNMQRFKVLLSMHHSTCSFQGWAFAKMKIQERKTWIQEPESNKSRCESIHVLKCSRPLSMLSHH